LNASVGDEVQVALETKSFMKMTLWAYGFPLVMLLFGILLGNYYFQRMGFSNYELLSFAVGMLLLVLSYTILGKVDKKASKKENYELKMVKVIK
jgi:positive regulator of sigma E activity